MYSFRFFTRVARLIITIVLVGTVASHAQDLSQLFDETSPAIFKIVTYDRKGEEYAIGTGFFLDSTGRALTNYHVLQGATKALVKTWDKKTYPINNVVSWSRDHDMAMFSVQNDSAEQFPFIRLNKQHPRIGQKIFIVGNPLGLDRSLSDGIVSSVRTDSTFGSTIQFTAPVSHGNSGSPLMNMQGEAVGIVSFVMRDAQNVNFAVAIEQSDSLETVNALRFPADDAESLWGHNSGNRSSDSDYDDPNSTYYYLSAKVKFCKEISYMQQPVAPATALTIPKEGGAVYMYLGNDKPLATEEIIVEVYRKNGSRYDQFVEARRIGVKPDWKDTHFKYNFTMPGDYKVTMYSKKQVWINTSYLNIKYGKS